MSAHSPTGASGMERWEACPGSVRLSKIAPPRPAGVAADGGIVAHELAATWHETGLPPVFPNDEMFQAVYEYIKFCDSFYSPEHQRLGAIRGFETHFDHSAKYPGVYGTTDYWVYWPWLKHLTVIDFKYGEGKFVEVKNNPQCQYYAVGLILQHPEWDVATVEIAIVQPRCQANTGRETTRTWSTDWFELEQFKVRMLNAIERTNDPSAPVVPGDHCIFCPARAICPELIKERDLACARDFKTIKPGDTAVDVREIAKAMDKREALRGYLKALDELAYGILMSGGTIPGYKLVEKQGQRKYKDEALTINTLHAAGLSDTVIMTKPELLSPAQLEKAIPNYKLLINEHTKKESSGYTVVEESDKRPAVKRVEAQDEFKALTLESLGF